MHTIIWVVVAILLGLAFSFLIARGFSMRLYDASHILKRIVARDFGASKNGGDAVSHASQELNEIVTSAEALQGLARGVGQSIPTSEQASKK